jgi:hypothetical protein
MVIGPDGAETKNDSAGEDQQQRSAICSALKTF